MGKGKGKHDVQLSVLLPLLTPVVELPSFPSNPLFHSPTHRQSRVRLKVKRTARGLLDRLRPDPYPLDTIDGRDNKDPMIHKLLHKPLSLLADSSP